jgi:hypothetical protein
MVMPIKYGFVLNAAILASSGLNASKTGAAAAVAAAILIYYRDNFKIKKLGSFFILKFYYSNGRWTARPEDERSAASPQAVMLTLSHDVTKV